MNKKTIYIIAGLVLFLLGLSLFFLLTNQRGLNEKEDAVLRTDLQLAHPDLLIKDISVGQGQPSEPGRQLVLHYIGQLEDGTVFDSSYDKGRTFQFVLGQGRVIPGWEIGLEGMRPGGKRELTIPPYLAYGQSGVRNMVPPQSTIIFEIELLEVK